MNKKIQSVLFLVFLLTSITACTTRVADLTLVSTKNIDLSKASLDIRKGRRVKGEDCTIALLGFIPLGIPNLEEAIDDALEKGKGNIMVDQVSYRSGVYFVIASRSCIKVEGTVLRETDLNREPPLSNKGKKRPNESRSTNSRAPGSDHGSVANVSKSSEKTETMWRFSAGKVASLDGCVGTQIKHPKLEMIFKEKAYEEYRAYCSDGSERKMSCDFGSPCAILR